MRVTALWCGFALLVGCSGSTSIRPFGGAYDLISVDGEPDPQPLYRGTTTPELVGGTLNFVSDSLDVTLSLQAVDSTGRPTGDIEQLAGAIPYVRHGHSLLTAFDTSGYGDGLVPNGPAAPIGMIVSGNVILTLPLPVASSTGFGSETRNFLFTPEP